MHFNKFWEVYMYKRQLQQWLLKSFKKEGVTLEVSDNSCLFHICSHTEAAKTVDAIKEVPSPAKLMKTQLSLET